MPPQARRSSLPSKALQIARRPRRTSRLIRAHQATKARHRSTRSGRRHRHCTTMARAKNPTRRLRDRRRCLPSPQRPAHRPTLRCGRPAPKRPIPAALLPHGANAAKGTFGMAPSHPDAETRTLPATAPAIHPRQARPMSCPSEPPQRQKTADQQDHEKREHQAQPLFNELADRLAKLPQQPRHDEEPQAAR